jgi:UDP-N-acetylmuramyl pentapeptide phosphotransferase/UDP-N-acetylglucosamine-1-phosphate transferase
MHALPFLLALTAAAILAPAVLRTLSDAGHTRPNFRARELPFPFGILSLVAALVALIPLALWQKLGSGNVLPLGTQTVALYVLGVAVLGLIDDTFSGEHGDLPSGQLHPRGWRGHGGATLQGKLSTGLLKAVGSLGLALFVLINVEVSTGRYLLAVAVLVLATNVFNLLDLRPGRSIKAFVLLGAGLTIGSSSLGALWTLGLFVAPALVAGLYDLRERAMLGDTGANLLGALAGLWLILTLSDTGQAIALVLLLLITVYGEFRSISALVERTPGLRALDSWGRPS